MQTFRRILIPQTLPVALPQLCSSTIDTVKDTSLLFTIGIVDMMGRADLIIGDAYGLHKMETYIVVAAFYWLITLAVILLFRVMEKHYEKFKMTTGLKYKEKKE